MRVGVLIAAALLLAGPLAAAKDLHWEGQRFDPTISHPFAGGERSSLDALEPGQAAILQFDRRLGSGLRRDLQWRGIEILGYVPDAAWLVMARVQVPLALLPDLRWAGPLLPSMKKAADLGPRVYQDPSRDHGDRWELVAKVFGDAEGFSLRAITLGAEIISLSEDANLVSLIIAPERIDALCEDSRLRRVQNRPEWFALNDRTSWVLQSGIEDEQPLWDLGLRGQGQVVGIMDSGLDLKSCFFSDPNYDYPGNEHRKIIDYDLLGGNSTGFARDGCPWGHGTHVAGTVAGNQEPLTGSSDASGMAPEARIVFQDVGEDGFWSCIFGFLYVPDDLASAFGRARERGARLHTNSWGGGGGSYDLFCEDVDRFLHYNQDCMLFFAAGNSGQAGDSTIGTPGLAKNLVTVGATRQTPYQGERAYYSSRGPSYDGRIKPTICAPGGSSDHLYIESADNAFASDADESCLKQGWPFQGTSMATPAAAGSAALVRQYYEEGYYPSGAPEGLDAFSPGGALVKATLLASSALMDEAGDRPGREQGWGRPVLDEALYFSGDARQLYIHEHQTGLESGESWSVDLDLNAGPLSLALVWSDAPALAGVGKALVNDLNLSVDGPDGLLLGNVFAAGYSASGGSADTLNVEEMVILESAPAGSYLVRVEAGQVPSGPQPFALVASGAIESTQTAPEAEGGTTLASTARLTPNQPNPFNPSTRFRMLIPEELEGKQGELAVFDIAGRRVATLYSGPLNAGDFEYHWNAGSGRGHLLPSGVYFCRIGVEGLPAHSIKMTLLK